MVVIRHRLPSINHIRVTQVLHSHTLNASTLMFERHITHTAGQYIKRVHIHTFLLHETHKCIILRIPEMPVPSGTPITFNLFMNQLQTGRCGNGSLLTTHIYFRTVIRVHQVFLWPPIIFFHPSGRSPGTMVIKPTLAIKRCVERQHMGFTIFLQVVSAGPSRSKRHDAARIYGMCLT